MTGAGIFDGDTLIVDRAVEPTPGRVVVVALDGRLAVKRLKVEDGRPVLASENDAHPPVDLQALGDGQRAEVWGVVTHVLHKP